MFNNNGKKVLLILGLIILGITISISKRVNTEDDNEKSIDELILDEVKTHPELEAQDVYKFIHQASLGSEHAVKDKISAKQWLDKEIQTLDWNQKDKIVNQLSPNGKLVRVNIRPYLKAGHDPEELLNAFVKTANYYKGSKSKLKEYISIVKDLAESDQLPFSANEWNDLVSELEKENYPAVHHSEIYNENYSPAYRVVNIKYLPNL